jgi:hypothetical protein
MNVSDLDSYHLHFLTLLAGGSSSIPAKEEEVVVFLGLAERSPTRLKITSEGMQVVLGARNRLRQAD